MIALKKLFALILIAALLTLAGCTVQPAPTPTPAPEPTPTPTEEPFSPVWTDWSKLEPYEAATPVYTLHTGYCGDGPVQARDDYGALLVYIGKYADMAMMYVEPYLPFYGLVNDKGEVITDPVYSSITFYDDFLVLERGDPDGIAGNSWAAGTYTRTIAAADLSWVLELEDEYFVGCGLGYLTTAREDGSLLVRDASGDVVGRFARELFTEAYGESIMWGGFEGGGPYINWTKDGIGYAYAYNQENGARMKNLYLDLKDGSVSDAPPPGMPEEYDWTWTYADDPEPPEIKGSTYLDPVKDRVTGKYYFYGNYREHVQDIARSAVFDSDGKLIAYANENEFYYHPAICAGLISSIENGFWCYREIDGGELVFRYPMRTNSD